MSDPVTKRFRSIDVFPSGPLSGNPLAVVCDADDLSDAQMLAAARWLNLSETSFLLTPTLPGAHYRVRIFTPTGEIPFAGHPTLGSCQVWLETQAQPGAAVTDPILQECEIGLVAVRRTGIGLAFAAPPLTRSGPLDGDLVQHIASVLGVAPSEILSASWVDNGAGWVGVLLRDADSVLALTPAAVDLDIGVVARQSDAEPTDFEVRAFFPKNGSTAEDPATGSLNAGLAQWLISQGRAQPPYAVRQGTAIGHNAHLHIFEADGALWVGGATNTIVAGTIVL